MATLLILLLVSAPDPLPRRAMLGVGTAPGDGDGVVVKTVFDDTSASKLGIETGDVILSVDGKPTPTGPELVAAARSLRSGQPLTVELRRHGQRLTLTGRALGRPAEQWAGSTVSYESVGFRGGRLRSIMVKPRGVRRPPVVFFVQGYTCASVEWLRPHGIYRQLFDPIVAAGFALYRVEKLGVGDSQTSENCKAADFGTEQAAFEAAYADMFERSDIDRGNVFVFGHSMGGVVAPLLASHVRAPRGVAVYGTVLRPWDQYLIDIVRVQPVIVSGSDPVSAARRANAIYDSLRDYLLRDVDPNLLIARSPDLKSHWREAWGFEGGAQLIGRDHGFWQGLAKVDLTTAWHQTKAPVLVMYGESDVAAIDDKDHRMIARVVNLARPGSGQYVAFPETDHGFARVGDEATHRKHRADGSLDNLTQTLNPDVRRALLSWLETQVQARSPARRGSR
ncbi:MAG: alpha/beta fold hydrolase [Myxococcota bacterium]